MNGCTELVFDKENAAFNEAAFKMYGSEISTASFGMKYCGKPVVWDDRCDEHKKERRSGKDRRGGRIWPGKFLGGPG